MKFRRVYVIDGVPEEDFYEQNASDMDHLLSGEYWKISYEKDFNNNSVESHKPKPDSTNYKMEDLPF